MQTESLPPQLRQHVSVLWPDETHDVALARGPQLWRGEEAYALVPNARRTTLLLPVGSRRAAATALASSGAGSATARIRSAVLSGAARAGAARILPHRLVVRPRAGAESLISRLSSELSAELVASVSLGPMRANRKPVLMLMDRRRTRVMAFTKVAVNELTRTRLDLESTALRRLASADLGTLVAPALLSTGRWHGAVYMTQASVGSSARRAIDPRLRDRAARDLVAAFPSRTIRLSDSRWWRGVRERLEGADGDGSRELRIISRQIQERAGGIAIVIGAQHGDWTPWNLQTECDRAMVWDWERFADDVPVGLDQFHYEFHRATAIDGHAAEDAVTALVAREREIAAAYGAAQSAPPHVLTVLSLIGAGERFVTDGQLAAGSTKGSARAWLVPTLTSLVERL